MPDENPLKGHTSSLTDGDFLLSPSLTNLYEAAHGNGILLLEDGAVSTSSLRRNVSGLPGAVSYSSNNVLSIKSGYAVIDGLVVDFGGGYSNNAPQDYALELRDSTVEGANNALTDGPLQSCLFVVYVSTYGHTDYKHIHVEMGTPVTSGFPVTPEAFLADPLSSLSSKQSTVLAVVKCEYSNAVGGGNNDLDLNITNVYDMRTFISAGPKYFAPMTKDVVGTYTNRVNDHNTMDGMHGGGSEQGSFDAAPFDAMWTSKNASGDSVLYFAGDQSSDKRTWRLGPDIPTSYTGASDQTFKFDEANVFHLTPSQSIELNPRGTFPIGHMLFIYNFSGHIIEFNETVDRPSALSGTAKFDIAANTSFIATFDGAIWKKTFVSTNVTSTSHGAAHRIQISNGSGSHTSDAGLTYNASTDILTVTGKTVISGLVQDPTGLELTAAGSNPGTTTGDTLWLNSGDSNRLYQGSTKILQVGDSVGATVLTGLTDTPANYTGHGAKIVAVNGSAGGNGTAVEFRTLAATDIPAALTSATSIGPANGTLTVSNDLVVTGNLLVSGSSSTINVGTLTVEDKHIELAKGSGNDAAADGGGVILYSSQGTKDILWNDNNDAWQFNQHIYPSTDSQYNLGSAAIRFANGFTDTFRTGTLTVDSDITVASDVFTVKTSTNKVGVNQVAPVASLQINKLGMDYATTSVTSHTKNTAIDTTIFDKTQFRGAEVIVEVINTSDSRYEISKCVLTHNGTTPYLTNYGTLNSGGAGNCTITGVISGNNVQIRVTTPDENAVNGDNFTVNIGWAGFRI